MVKGRDVSRNLFTLIIVGNQALLPRAGEVNYLQRHVVQGGQRFDDCLIDPAGALTPAHDEQRRQIGAQSQFFACYLPINPAEFSSNRRPGDFSLNFRKKLGAFLKSEQDSANHARGKPVGLARNCI